MYECPNCAGNLKFDIVRQQYQQEEKSRLHHSFYKDGGRLQKGLQKLFF